MGGTIHPLPQYAFMARRSVKKYRDSFTFPFTSPYNDTEEITEKRDRKLEVSEMFLP